MDTPEKKHVSRKTKLTVLALAVLLVILVFTGISIHFISSFGDALIEENAHYLAEITEHIAVNVEIVIANMQRAMQSVGLVISGVQRDDENRAYLNRLRALHDFEYVGVALPDGMLHATLPSEDVDISTTDYFRRALAGESVVQYVPVKIFKDHVISGFLISAPIYNLVVDAEQPTGVLVAMLDMEQFADSVYILGFNGQGATYLIDGDGEILMQTKQLDHSNLYTVLANDKFEDGYSITQMQADLGAKQAGFAIYSDYGVEKFMHYRHMGIADWSVVSVIEKDLITAETTRLTQRLLAIGIVVIILFPLLLLFALASMQKSRMNLQASRTKSAFLANMSHEIRTPMNAIVGIGEILLREEMPDRQKDYVLSMVSAGNGLLTIINDILDISKMESGKFSIQEEPYELESLIYDVVAVIAVRIGDRPIKLLVDVDPSLPKCLIGDMIRVKQVLINILGNAVKFTNAGSITLALQGNVQEGRYSLTMRVTDTGIGIRPEDLERLFDSFSQVDTHRNRSLQGTGLGLSISKQLCEMMGGGITVASTYGEGSAFTVSVLQTMQNQEKMIPMPDGSARLLLYEPSELLRAHFAGCMNQLRLQYVLCESYERFFAEAQTSNYTHALAQRETLRQLAEEADVPPRLTPISLVGMDDQVASQDYQHTIIGPLFTLQLAAILCDRPAQTPMMQRGGIDILSIAPMPFVKVLLVDDNEVNLQVARGLMTPYHMQVDCASSGKIAIRMLGEAGYDLVFMDHMMPEMDGVEALKLIRALPGPRRKVPVVALTANVTRGAQDLFLQTGFNDFLSKPIDTTRLNAVLRKWLRDLNESREKENPVQARAFYEQLAQTPHGRERIGDFAGAVLVDFAAGCEKLGSEAVYRSILATYCRSAQEKLANLPQLLDADLEKFTIEVHGIKGASGGICATAAATAAAALETLARARRLPEIREYLPEFLTILRNTLEEIDAFAGQPHDGGTPQTLEKRTGRFTGAELLHLKEAFWTFDSDTIKTLLASYTAFVYDEREQTLLRALAQSFRAYEFETPVQLIEAYEQNGEPEGGCGDGCH